MKHIGILAHSFEGATLCFHTACMEGVAKLGAHMHPEITLTCSPMALVLDAWERGDNAELRAFFMKDAERLAAAGADFFVLPDNTAHIAMESNGAPFPLPGLHIGEVVAEQAAREGRRKVGILGTKYTMNGPVYPGALGRRGIGWAVPSPEDQKIVNDVIFDELCLGVFTDTVARRLPPDHREAEAGWLRLGRARLHGDSAAGDAGRVAIAYAGLDQAIGKSGRRGCRRGAADTGLARRPDRLIYSAACRMASCCRTCRLRLS